MKRHSTNPVVLASAVGFLTRAASMLEWCMALILEVNYQPILTYTLSTHPLIHHVNTPSHQPASMLEWSMALILEVNYQPILTYTLSTHPLIYSVNTPSHPTCFHVIVEWCIALVLEMIYGPPSFVKPPHPHPNRPSPSTYPTLTPSLTLSPPMLPKSFS